MNNESISVPKATFAELDLHDGDIIEGRTCSESVEVRVVRRDDEASVGMTADQFVNKWCGQFPDIPEGVDPRLDALLKKHVKPT